MLFIVAQYCLPSRILADPHLENINGKKVKMLYHSVHTIYFYKLNPVIRV